jgi:AcrR family transcriptional regulator
MRGRDKHLSLDRPESRYCLMALDNLQDKRVAGGSDLESTRDRILDLAEDLFAEAGIDRVTIRAVTAAANVNVAAIHYYFGSKDELLRAIFIRRLSGALAEQTARLSNFTPSGDSAADVRDLIRFYVEPPTAIDSAANNYRFGRLLSELTVHDESVPSDLFHYTQKEVIDAYQAILAKVLPELSQSDIAWRLEFVNGIIGHASRARARLELDRPRKPAKAKPDDFVEQLVNAAVAIFCAPPVGA